MSLDRVLRIQGMIFCFVAVLTALIAVLLPRLASQYELFVCIVLIAILGVPHGAFDTLFGQRLYGLRGVQSWTFFVVAYIGIGACIVALWWAWPLFFLIAFLLVTALHFSGDPQPGTYALSRFLYGGAIIVLPNFWYADEVLRLFQFLVYREADATGLLQLSAVLRWIAVPWCVALVACALFEARNSIQAALELATVAAIALVAPPLIAFTVFFCVMHGARHVLRTLDGLDRNGLKPLIAAAAAAMFAVFITATMLFFAQPEVSIDARIIQIVFVGLAALTVPHMALVERVRFRGWR